VTTMPSQSTDNHVPVIEVIINEELDSWAVPRLSTTLVEALELHPAQLVVDLSECPRIDAAVIGLLLDIHRQARRAGSQLTLRSPSPRSRRNLQLAHADRVLHVTPAAAPGIPAAAPDSPGPCGAPIDGTRRSDVCAHQGDDL
jgi:anti-sigma B factor antagonist